MILLFVNLFYGVDIPYVFAKVGFFCKTIGLFVFFSKKKRCYWHLFLNSLSIYR